MNTAVSRDHRLALQIFGGNSNLYDYTILFPAIIGSLSVVVIFLLVRLFAGTPAGLFASMPLQNSILLLQK